MNIGNATQLNVRAALWLLIMADFRIH